MTTKYSSTMTLTPTEETADPGINQNTASPPVSSVVTPHVVMLLTAVAGVLIMTLLVSIISLFISFRRAHKAQHNFNRQESSVEVEPIALKGSVKNSISKPLNQNLDKLKNPGDLKTRSLDRPTTPPPQPPVGGSVKQSGERLFIPRSHMPNAFRRSRLPTAPPPPGDQAVDIGSAIETSPENLGNVTLYSIDVIQEEPDGANNTQ